MAVSRKQPRPTIVRITKVLDTKTDYSWDMNCREIASWIVFVVVISSSHGQDTHKLRGRLLCMDNSAVPEGTLADFFQYVTYEPEPEKLEVSHMKIKNVTIGENGAFDIIVPTRKNSKGQIVRISAVAFRSNECKQGKHLNRGIVTDIEQVDQDLGTIKLNS
uniref:Uncharacterized protein n=1 Tax=Romanomermis culicivorax TaxID=13658 RepID=A0A915JWS2_ROMCU